MTPLESVVDLEKREAALRVRMVPAHIAQEVSRAVDAEMEKYTANAFGKSFVMAPDSFRKEIELRAREVYDAQLHKDSADFRDESDRSWAALQATKDAASQLPNPFRAEDAQGASETTHALRQVALRLDRDHAERRLTGKTLSQIAAMHEAADDRLDEVLRYVIEDQSARGWADIDIKQDGDLAGAERLKKSISGSRLARLIGRHPELIEAEQRLAKLRSSAVTDALLRLKSSSLTLVSRGA